MEPLILYFVLFFPGIYNSPFSGGIPLEEIIPFSILKEIVHTLTYTVPSLALLWFIISDKKGVSAIKKEKPQINDLFSLGIGLPALIIIGLGISLLLIFLNRTAILTPPPKIEPPANIQGWIIMAFSCLGTGYLEESFFRFYLLNFLEKRLPNPIPRIIFSTILFSLCHIYEGPWGIANAALAGILLAIIYIHYKSLHGIALAHGGYNIFVYIMGAFSL